MPPSHERDFKARPSPTTCWQVTFYGNGRGNTPLAGVKTSKDKANPFELMQTRGKERANRQQKYFRPREITGLHADAGTTEHIALEGHDTDAGSG